MRMCIYIYIYICVCVYAYYIIHIIHTWYILCICIACASDFFSGSNFATRSCWHIQPRFSEKLPALSIDPGGSQRSISWRRRSSLQPGRKVITVYCILYIVLTHTHTYIYIYILGPQNRWLKFLSCAIYVKEKKWDIDGSTPPKKGQLSHLCP